MNISKFENEITICTVSHNDEIFIQKNIEMLSKLNKQIKINWIIAINKNINKKIKFENHGSNILLIDGINENLIGSAALHHSISLNLTKKEVKTRFVLFLDPDFFLLKKIFINEMIDYMQSTNTPLIGSPYHPKWHTKFRYFPTCHCMFVDTNTISLDVLDFRPTKVVWDKEYSKYNQINHRKSLLNRIFDKIIISNNFIKYNFVHRKYNGFDGDTSHRIYLNLRDKYKFKIFNPGFNIKNDWLIPISWRLNNLIEFFLPEKYCFFPKRKKLIIFETKFINYLSSFSYECFYWKNQPIGFHIRGHPKKIINKRNKEKELENINNIISIFFDLN